MTAAMDGMSAAVGIIVVLAVLGGLFSMLGTAFGRLKF
jgi:Na+-translocating ferredoxin:NAD+ oxidoreductase RnfE subunit